MIIELPDIFYEARNEENFVRIVNGILEIKGEWNFEDLMIDLTYKMKGRNKCYYCRREVSEKKITIDHLFPKNFGGITITNNLEPTCRWCNNKKTNMNQYEFGVWRGLKTKEERISYYHSVVKKKARRIRNVNMKKGFDLPERWIEQWKLENIRVIRRIFNNGGRRYKKIMSFARRYNKLPRPIIVSYNGVLLDGMTTYNVAMDLYLNEVPVIVLENVIVLD